MTAPLYASIDDEGRLVLPAEAVELLGLTPGSQMRLDPDRNGLRLRPPINTLRRVYVEITNQCNLHCSTCMRNVWQVAAGNMDFQTFEGILSNIQGLTPQPELFIGGYGEPLSHPDCLAMVAKAKSLGLRVSMITNGTLLGESESAALIDLQMDMLWVSLDGASAECYTDVRLGNALPLVLKNLRRFRELQVQRFGIYPWNLYPRLGIAFVAMQRNIHDLPQVIQLGTEVGAVEFSISNVLAHNQSLQKDSLYHRTLNMIDGRRFQQFTPLIRAPLLDVTPATLPVLAELLKTSNRLELGGSEIGSNGDHCPFADRGSLSIRWDGKVSPCLPLLYTHTNYLEKRLRTSREYFVGDLKESSLSQIWNNEDYVVLRQRLQDFDFAPCTFCNSCEMADENMEDCFGNTHPVCGGCLWAQGLIRCP